MAGILQTDLKGGKEIWSVTPQGRTVLEQKYGAVKQRGPRKAGVRKQNWFDIRMDAGVTIYGKRSVEQPEGGVAWTNNWRRAKRLLMGEVRAAPNLDRQERRDAMDRVRTLTVKDIIPPGENEGKFNIDI